MVGFLGGGTMAYAQSYLVAFRQGLSETGYSDGRNVVIEYRWANGQYDRLPQLAAELVQRQVAVLATWTPVAALAGKHATTSIPVVFSLGSDPVKDGLVASLNRPGANITGATFFGNLLDAKRLDLFHQLVPNAKIIAVLLNPKNPEVEAQKERAEEAARSLGLQLAFAEASTEPEIEPAIASLDGQHATALLISGDAFLGVQSDAILKAATARALPTCWPVRSPVEAGGLMSYSASFPDTFRQAGNYVGLILKGKKPGDLPVQQPSKFEFVINLKTAKALGLNVPPNLLATADEVIE